MHITHNYYNMNNSLNRTGGESKSMTSVPFKTKNCGLYVCHGILLLITPSLTQPMYSMRSPIAKFRLYSFILEYNNHEIKFCWLFLHLNPSNNNSDTCNCVNPTILSAINLSHWLRMAKSSQ